MPPLAPQAVVAVPGSQVFPWQQPLAQEVESHTHLPPWHRSPVAHADPAPQLHTPASEQLSDFSSQVSQLEPPCPQALAEGVTHCDWALQQPLGQLVGVHVQPPSTHSCPL